VNILVTVGSLPYPMDRLVRAMDDWAGRHPEHAVTMQIGYSRFQARFRASDVAVSHGSAGPILAARRLGIPLVLVPRQSQHGECYNDHQVEICEAIRGESAMREIVLDIQDLEPALARAIAKRRDGRRYQAHRLKQRLVDTVAAFVDNTGRD